jgi:hypothetical protein
MPTRGTRYAAPRPFHVYPRTRLGCEGELVGVLALPRLEARDGSGMEPGRKCLPKAFLLT